MKLRDIYTLCKQNVWDIENVNSTKVTSEFNKEGKLPDDKMEKIFCVNGLENAIVAANRLKEVKCLDRVIRKFLDSIPYYNKNSIYFEGADYIGFLMAKNELVSCIECIISLYEMMGFKPESITGLDIKLPIPSDFSEFRNNIDDLEFIFTKCPFFQHESEKLKFQNVDIGSTWLTFAIVGISVTAGSILLNNIAAFIDKCMIIRSHNQTIQKQKFDLEQDESYVDDREIIIKYLNQTYKKTVDIAIKELEEITNHKLADGDERGRTEQAFDRLGKLIDKGLQIYSTIDSPEETKALFEPLEMKYLEIDKQLKLLEKKDDEQNNN